MTLISTSIPNLINGVSQQPPSIRLVTQAEKQENGLSSVVDGLTKRPPQNTLALYKPVLVLNNKQTLIKPLFTLLETLITRYIF